MTISLLFVNQKQENSYEMMIKGKQIAIREKEVKVILWKFDYISMFTDFVKNVEITESDSISEANFSTKRNSNPKVFDV